MSTYGNDVELQRQSAGRKRDNCALSAISLTTRAQQQCNCAPVFQFLLCCAERNTWFASSSIPHKTVRTLFFYQTSKTVFKFDQNLILGLIIRAKIHMLSTCSTCKKTWDLCPSNHIFYIIKVCNSILYLSNTVVYLFYSHPVAYSGYKLTYSFNLSI